jgi:hypothetical protein
MGELPDQPFMRTAANVSKEPKAETTSRQENGSATKQKLRNPLIAGEHLASVLWQLISRILRIEAPNFRLGISKVWIESVRSYM